MVISCPERASTMEVHWYSVNPCSSRGKGGRTLMTTYDKQESMHAGTVDLLCCCCMQGKQGHWCTRHARPLPFVTSHNQGRHGAAGSILSQHEVSLATGNMARLVP